MQNEGNGRSHEFRQRIFSEHFGIPKGDSIDILDDDLWKRLINNAMRNTEIYRNVFACIPDDMVSRGN